MQRRHLHDEGWVRAVRRRPLQEAALEGAFRVWVEALRAGAAGEAGEAGEDRGLPATAVIVAHPDDEAVGIGGHLRALGEAWFVHVTDGAPRDGGDARAHGFATVEEYAAARRGELRAALAAAGIERPRLHALGCVDQGASGRLAELARRIAEWLREVRPAVVVTHPYEGGHPDHDATAFAVEAAGELLRRRGERAPLVVEMSSYHQGLAGVRHSEFLGGASAETVTIALSPEQRELKGRLRECFVTQRETLRCVMGLEQECFRRAPVHDFARPPHGGKLFYEQYSWGMTGEKFRALARDAQAALAVETSA